MKKRTLMTIKTFFLIALVIVFEASSGIDLQFFSSLLTGTLGFFLFLCLVLGLVCIFAEHFSDEVGGVYFCRIMGFLFMALTLIFLAVVLGHILKSMEWEWQKVIVIITIIYIAFKKIFLELKLKFKDEE